MHLFLEVKCRERMFLPSHPSVFYCHDQMPAQLTICKTLQSHWYQYTHGPCACQLSPFLPATNSTYISIRLTIVVLWGRGKDPPPNKKRPPGKPERLQSLVADTSDWYHYSWYNGPKQKLCYFIKTSLDKIKICVTQKWVLQEFFRKPISSLHNPFSSTIYIKTFLGEQ